MREFEGVIRKSHENGANILIVMICEITFKNMVKDG